MKWINNQVCWLLVSLCRSQYVVVITLREDRSCVINVWNAVSRIIQASRYAVFSDERKPEAEEGRVSLNSCSDEEEVCIQEAD